MQTKIKKMNVPTGRRILCISDVHGEIEYLKQGLKKVGFGPWDLLFINGDLIEKGSESLKTLRYIMQLVEGGNVHVIMGNNDANKLDILQLDGEWSNQRFLAETGDCLKSGRRSLLLDMLEEAGIAMPDQAHVAEVRSHLCKRFVKELDFIRSLPTIIETQTLIFVHGGIPSLDFDELVQHNAYEFMKNDNFAEKGYCFERFVVLGHWPVVLYNLDRMQLNPIIDRKRKIISIDGGCSLKNYAQLNILVVPDIESENFTWERYDPFPEVEAMDAQEESTDSINITWVNRQVEVLQEGPEFTRVRHICSGRVMDVRTQCLYEWEGEQCCDEYTDYQLKIQPGDIVKLLEETSRGYLVKKQGVVGWYHGRIREAVTS